MFQLLFIAVVSGVIGYLTNVLAIRALFRPFEPIGFGPFVFQGLIPKRKDELAQRVGSLVAEDLLNQDDLIGQIISREDEAMFQTFIINKVDRVILEKTAYLPRAIQGALLNTVEDKMTQEMPQLFEDFINLAENQIREKVDVASLIEGKIQALDLATIEQLVLKVASKELRAIEWLGLFMGFVIGIVQGLIVLNS
ncbi:DUF445 family protein [Peptoniphilus equinus]|uniref:DUF445 family protein n=1 Tax=Peptoniphilus equinus TaxID=3016343 RepID=A0ABY7QX16_9FIRM|nr:DUF445 family protein [Peptoniphilus equinus]WBW50635.1 DUF445 family protein [Peptoniphilus equinus]